MDLIYNVSYRRYRNYNIVVHNFAVMQQNSSNKNGHVGTSFTKWQYSPTIEITTMIWWWRRTAAENYNVSCLHLCNSCENTTNRVQSYFIMISIFHNLHDYNSHFWSFLNTIFVTTDEFNSLYNTFKLKNVVYTIKNDLYKWTKISNDPII